MLAQDSSEPLAGARAKADEPAGESLPPSVRFPLARAWRAALALRHEEADAFATLAERKAAGLTPEVARRCREEIELLRSAGAALRDEGANALTLALSCSLQGWFRPIAGAAATVCRFGYWQLGDIKSFYALTRGPADVAIGRREVLPTIFDLCIEAAIDIDRLRFPTAKRLASDALSLAEEWIGSGSAAATLPASLLAQIAYEEGNPDHAEALLYDRLPVIAAEGNIECAIRAYGVLARIAAQRGQLSFASMILQEAESLGERRDWPRLVAASLSERLGLALRYGRVADAMSFAERLGHLAARHMSRDGFAQREIERHAALARCRVALVVSPSRALVAVLRQLEFEMASRRNLYLRLQIGLHLVDALMALGEEEEAIGTLSGALELGAMTGLCSSFIDGSERMNQALRRFHDLDHGAEDGLREVISYVGSLLGQHRRRGTPAAGDRQSSRAKSSLSERERDILRLIGGGQSNKGIAKSLEIAPETVKSHIKHIFVKLGAGTRAEAVSKAQGLGLI